MSAAPIQLDELSITRHSADDDLLSVRVLVTDIVGPGEHHFNITPAQANELAAQIKNIR